MLHAILRSYLMKRIVIHFLLYCTDLNKEGRPFTQWDVAGRHKMWEWIFFTNLRGLAALHDRG